MASTSRTVRVSRNPLTRALRRGGKSARRAIAETEATWLVALICMCLLSVVAGIVFASWWPLTAYVIPVVLAMNVLSLVRMAVLDVVVALCMTASITQLERGLVAPTKTSMENAPAIQSRSGQRVRRCAPSIGARRSAR